MKSMWKTILSLILLILFLLACFAIIFIIFAATWLHTFKAFTKETPVAEIQLSEQKEDDLGKYFEVTVTQVKGRSPVSRIFNPGDDTEDNLDPQTFVLYGDEFGIGGPIMQFEDILTFLNFETVYKLGFVEGVYTDPDLQNERNSEMRGREDLNGGYKTWRNVYQDYRKSGLRGDIIRLFIKNLPQIDPQRVFVLEGEAQDLTLCITEDGFIFCD